MSSTNNQKDQNGLAAIVIVTVIITILTLLTIGFARLMDKEFRQATDRELASQANYAAESGMNDARAYVIDQENKGQDPTTSGCKDLSNASALPSQFVLNGSISAYYANPTSPPSQNNTVKYTCVIINAHPKNLDFGNVQKNQSVVFKMAPQAAAQNLYFSWDNSDAPPQNSITSLGPSLPKETNVNSDPRSATQIGMLRVTIYPAVNGGGSSDNQNVFAANSSRTYVLYANADSFAGQLGSINYSSGTQGLVTGQTIGQCNLANRGNSPVPNAQATGYACNLAVSNLDTSGAGFYYVRVTALYQNLSVGLQVNNGGKAVPIDKAQAVLDVTGEGNDILKRLVGRLALSSNFNLPNYAIQSMDTVCKRQRLPKTGPGTYSPSVIDDPPSSNGTTGDGPVACKP